MVFRIIDRRQQVLQRRQAVKDACQERAKALEASKNYQEFSAEADDLKVWLAEKMKIASDESYRDLNNIEKKMQKHEAFERELRANEGQLRTVSKLGAALIAQGSYRSGEVNQILQQLNDSWKNLHDISLEKTRRLNQALAQENHNKEVENVKQKLKEIDGTISTVNVGTDLRSCRDLLKKQEMLEHDMSHMSLRVHDLINQSQDMDEDGHFNSETIYKGTTTSKQKLKDLNSPVQRRRAALEEALEYYEFGFQIDSEMQWIKEHLPLVTSEEVANNLHQALSFHKKNQKLHTEITGHQPVINKVLELGQKLIKQRHPESASVSQTY